MHQQSYDFLASFQAYVISVLNSKICVMDRLSNSLPTGNDVRYARLALVYKNKFYWKDKNTQTRNYTESMVF